MTDSYTKRRCIEKLHEAVEYAIDSGMTPKDLVQEMRISWDSVLREKASDANNTFNTLLKGKL